MKPLVSVIMPVYNAEKYLNEAILSVLGQSFTNFEFLIFNDGSTDKSSAIINSFKDDRITLFEANKNKGYVYHLNQGLNLARGRYIARMDADDICYPNRFEEQVKFLEKHQEYGVVGSRVELIDTEGKTLNYTINLFQKNEDLKVHLFYQSCFIHPSVMIRKSVLQDTGLKYDTGYMPAEDYHLWKSLSENTLFYNTNNVLLKYRTHTNQISKTKNDIQQSSGDRVRKALLNQLGIPYTKAEFELHRKVFLHQYPKDINNIKLAGLWLKKLYIANAKAKLFPQVAFRNNLAYHWLQLCTHNAKIWGFPLITLYFSSVLSIFYSRLLLVKVKFVLKACRVI